MRNLLLIIGIVFGLVLIAPAGAEEGREGYYYRSVDEDGTVTFSDTPSPGAVEIEKKQVPTVPAPVQDQPRFDPRATEPEAPGERYSRLEITRPEDDSVVWDDQAHLNVDVALSPELATRNGHELVLYMDGAEAARSRTPSFHLTEVNRGTYSLAVAVVDDQGREIQRSPAISFHMRQHSVLHPSPQAPGTMPGPGGLNPGSIQPGQPGGSN